MSTLVEHQVARQNTEEDDVGRNQHLDAASASLQRLPSVPPSDASAPRLRIAMTALAVCVVPYAICFKSGRFFAGVWLAATFLSWAFLFGSGHKADQTSDAPKERRRSAGRRLDERRTRQCFFDSSGRKPRSRARGLAEKPMRRSSQG